MSPSVWDAMMQLRQYLFDTVYFSDRAKAEEPKAYRVVQALFEHYLEHPEDLPEDACPSDETQLVWCVIDYVAGMTDRFAIREFERLFVPEEMACMTGAFRMRYLCAKSAREGLRIRIVGTAAQRCGVRRVHSAEGEGE